MGRTASDSQEQNWEGGHVRPALDMWMMLCNKQPETPTTGALSASRTSPVRRLFLITVAALPTRRLFLITVAALAISLTTLAASPISAARAGQYHVYTCRTPSGEPAPTDGWTSSIPSGVSYSYDYAKDTCLAGGALIAALGDQTTHAVETDRVTWTFSAPTNDVIKGATLRRAGDADGGAIANASYQFWLAGPNDLDHKPDLFDQCWPESGCPPPGVGNFSQPLSIANLLYVPAENLGTNLYLNVSCEGSTGASCPAGHGDANGYAAVIYLYAADLVLEQSAGPSAGNVDGELASAPAVSGTSDVTFDASDPGAGVWEVTFSVDGKVVQSVVPNENGGRCRNVGQTTDGLPAFLYLQPCLPSERVGVGLDTTGLSNGAHQLVVSVVDAAGNSAPVVEREIDVDNPVPPVPPIPPQPNGTNASSQATLTARWAITTKAHLTSAWGKPETITGRLTAPGGVPIAGALIGATATPDYAGAKPLAIASPKTGSDGRFTLALPRGESSEKLVFSYRAHIGDAQPVATRTLTLSVRVGVSLSIAPRVTSVGHTIVFSGALHGAPIPPGGKQLVLEASSSGEWIEFRTISTDGKGRFHASYRFKFPGPISYRFRVLCKHEDDFPFSAGSSNVVGVKEL
jgi:hypothetical protein